MKSAKTHGTAIGWTHAEGYKGETYNPVQGCEKVSPACGLALPGEEDLPHGTCYACGIVHRGMQPIHVGLTTKRYGEPIDWTGEIRLMPERLDIPLKWRKPRMIFAGSMSDLWHKDVPREFLVDIFARVALTRRHVYECLTKRPQRMAKMMADPDFALHVAQEATEIMVRTGPYDRWRIELDDWIPTGNDEDRVWHPPVWPLPNAWMGSSIETDRYVWRADHLRKTPAAVRFLSCEPLLSELPSLDLTGISWCLIGGESGHGARRTDPAWIMDLINRCAAEGVACYMKQAGTVLAKEWGMSDRSGTNADEMPPEFRVRQWPVTTIPEGHLF